MNEKQLVKLIMCGILGGTFLVNVFSKDREIRFGTALLLLAFNIIHILFSNNVFQ